MGSIYRSEPMTLCQIFLQTDSAYHSVAELGELGVAQFRDLNSEMNIYQKRFVHEVRRCEEMERKLKYIEDEVLKDEIQVPDISENIPAPPLRAMSELEGNLTRLEEELVSINGNVEAMSKNNIQLVEMKAVLNGVTVLLDESMRREAALSINEASCGEAGPILLGMKAEHEKERKEGSQLQFITGVIRRDRVLNFEKLIWRMCRGKVYSRFSEITENNSVFGDSVLEKSVFILFFSGEAIKEKLKKICHGFQASVYNSPDDQAQRATLLHQIDLQMKDMKIVAKETIDYRQKIIHAAALNIKKWSIMILKLKSIFHTLNMFSVDVTQKCLIAECWVPDLDIPKVQEALRKGTELSGSNVHAVINEMQTHRNPPTYFRLNKFTQGFQNIIDAYGIASYREVNPAPWAIISFPFLFAVMFGDSGHGVIMFLAAAAFLIFEKKLISLKIKDEIFNTFFGGRYVIFLMSLFSIYTGLLYNDMYSKSINIFGSSWKNPYNLTELGIMEQRADAASESQPDLTFDPWTTFSNTSGPYPFGVDPVWNFAKNKLNFLNPMKMKTSVLLGIGQMTFGLMLSLCNYIHRRSWIDVCFVFIPQCLFLGCIFVYLCVQIVLKWIFIYVQPKFVFGLLYPGAYCAPSILIGLINMVMMKGRDPGYVYQSSNGTQKVTIDGKLYQYEMYDQCFQQEWYPHQATIEKALLAIAVISIPVMLFVKPFYLRWRHNRGLPVDDGHGEEGEGSDEPRGLEFHFADCMVYQAIHTIEFALGCVSHTASYLRLWALSLAHAQLSEVLWTMLLAMGLKMGGWAGAAGMFILFAIFAFLSIGILIMMEGLSAFLHTLRLHWVEFNSKFYHGNGYAFEPFSFHKLIRISEGLED